MAALLSIDLVTNPVTCTRYHSFPGAALPSADSADGRQSCQPITCVPAVAGDGIRGDDDDDDDDEDALISQTVAETEWP